ncbi:hypothetical protein NDU88_010287 [Pleurodeles waltl]|uniref:Uncharacterized protein n=1 Tax=Pleurodeles waltl TaxID=8319 RepID=A0AAV7RXR1_PLEWA|nr:hypothetical protein NDU88_010287 [Pleurodeles waltl]
MDFAISSLATDKKSIRLDIAGFQPRVSGLEQRVATVEDHLNTTPDCDQELWYLHIKLIDLEDRSRRDNVRFFTFPEQIEGTGNDEVCITADFSMETNDRRNAFLSLRPDYANWM